MKPPTSIAWENGPTGGASSGEVIAVLLMADSCRYAVRGSGWWSPRLRALPMPFGRLQNPRALSFRVVANNRASAGYRFPRQHEFRNTDARHEIPQLHYSHDYHARVARFCCRNGVIFPKRESQTRVRE